MKILVTPHAARAYRERIYRQLTEEQAGAEIEAALASPLFCSPAADGKRTFWGCRNRGGFGFVAVTDWADAGAEFLLVRTVGPYWFWHETQAQWKLFNAGSKRRFRLARLPSATTLRQPLPR